MKKASDKYGAVFIYLALALITLAVFGRLFTYEFIHYDDHTYVAENRNVQLGLNKDGIVWAFTTTYGSNWHPLTWLSHMLDCELFGLDAGRHHLVNIFFHIINTLLLFGVLKAMTGRVWASGFVAGLFALHPLHVESVAWISERKDVLSTFFWLLTMSAYLRYVRCGGVMRYLLVFIPFALGLMAKPMLVTLPFVLLLLDYWPLKRFQNLSIGFYRLVLEKLPFFVFSAVSCVITLVIEHAGAGLDLEALPLNIRIANTPVAYITYIIKMIWPTKLAVLYPHPGGDLTLWQAVSSAFLLLVISVGVIRSARNRKYLIVGWLWFIGTLVPVIGLVQVGSQAIADRYTYIPLIGLFIIVSFGASELLSKLLYGKLISLLSAVFVITALSIRTYIQVGYWRDSITLFEHTLRVTRNNSMIHNNLGIALAEQGRIDDAVSHYLLALQIQPDNAQALYNMGKEMSAKGRVDEAIDYYHKALEIGQKDAKVYNNLGNALKAKGMFTEAIDCYRKALKLDPEDPRVHNNLGIILASRGELSEATDHYNEALEFFPDSFEIHNNLGVALQSQGRLNEAVEHYRKALDMNPDSAELHNNLAYILVTNPNPTERNVIDAVGHAQRAVELTHYQNSTALNTLAKAYAAAGQFDKAVETAQKALTLASNEGNQNLATQIHNQLQGYEQAKP